MGEQRAACTILGTDLCTGATKHIRPFAPGSPSVAAARRGFCATMEISPGIETRRMMLLRRMKTRGCMFAANHIHSLDEAKLDLLEEVVELENPDFIKWFISQA